jgi:hypothetical protein
MPCRVASWVDCITPDWPDRTAPAAATVSMAEDRQIDQSCVSDQKRLQQCGHRDRLADDKAEQREKRQARCQQKDSGDRCRAAARQTREL